jgi:NAD(P)-dependent dehydrogenase (short-subunit alcohol dehydrogenase family)
MGLVTDVAKDDQVRAAVDAAMQQFGRLDGVVNNAGISPSDRDIVEDSDAAYLRAYRVNVLGALHVTKAASPYLTHGSSVVNIASLSGLMGAPGLGAYAASKAALIEWTRTAALELAGRGIRVNAIAPSGVDTRMLSGDSDVVRRERAWIDAAAAIPRLITPDEVAACVHFLLAHESSAVTGQCLVVDGGIGAGPTPALLDQLDRDAIPAVNPAAADVE